MLRLHSLGQSVIEAPGGRLTPESTRKFALVLYLLSETGRQIPRSRLTELIFPDRPDSSARHSLRELVYQLHKLGIELRSDSSGIGLDAGKAWIDYSNVISSNELDSEQVRAAQGGFLPGYAPTHSRAFSEWFESYRTRISLRLAAGVLSHAERSRFLGDWTTAEDASRACLALDPYNDDATLILAEAVAVGGSKAQAGRILDRYINDVGSVSKELKLSAAVLKRRINRRVADEKRLSPALPFAGRENEMRSLNGLFTRACSDQAQCVVLFGEPGIGKSRLISEFCRIAGLDGATTASVSLQPNDAYRPFGTFTDLLPSLIAMPGALGCAPESLRSLESLSRGNVDVSTLSGSSLGDETLCGRLSDALIDLVEAIASEQPLILAIEDADNIDRISSRVCARLLDTRRPTKLLVLLSVRRLRTISFLESDTPNFSSSQIGRIRAGAIQRIIESWASSKGLELDDQMRLWLEGTSQGNPLFLETLLSHYASTGDRFSVSPTLAALLDRRVEMLSPEAGIVLRICALLGRHSTIETISRATSLPQFVLLQAISDLENLSLIKAEGLWVYPAHPLIAEVSLKKAGAAESQAAHRCVALVLEAVFHEQNSISVLWDCAEHWISANDPARGLHAVKMCVRYALDVGRPGDAAELLNRAVGLELFREERVSIARELVLTADAAGEADLVFSGLRVLRRHAVSRKHDELEFSEFRARARTFQDAAIDGELLIECAMSADASPQHRVTAAGWILKFADMHGRPDLVEKSIAAIPDAVLAAVSPKDQLEFVLVRSCIRREWETAEVTARNLLEIAVQEAPALRSVSRLNAAVGLWRAGFLPDAIDTASAAYFDAYGSGSHRLALTAAALLTDLNLDIDLDEAATLWIGRALGIVSARPELGSHFSLAMVRIARAIYHGETREGQELFADAVERGLFEGGGLRERWREAFSARFGNGLIDARALDQDIERVLADVNSLHPMSGILEFEISTVCEALIRWGRAADARRVCDHFLASRFRTRAALSRGIRSTLRAVDAAVDSQAVKPRLSVMALGSSGSGSTNVGVRNC